MDLLQTGRRWRASLAMRLTPAGQELLRKINGRWWSQDKREVYPAVVIGLAGGKVVGVP